MQRAQCAARVHAGCWRRRLPDVRERGRQERRRGAKPITKGIHEQAAKEIGDIRLFDDGTSADALAVSVRRSIAVRSGIRRLVSRIVACRLAIPAATLPFIRLAAGIPAAHQSIHLAAERTQHQPEDQQELDGNRKHKASRRVRRNAVIITCRHCRGNSFRLTVGCRGLWGRFSNLPQESRVDVRAGSETCPTTRLGNLPNDAVASIRAR